MASIGDLLRDTALAERMAGARYGERDPYVLATQKAQSLGYPVPGATADEGAAQRYMATNLATERYGAPLTLLTNPLHEVALSWFAEGEGRPSLKRLQAGYRGTFDALDAQREREAQSVRSLLASLLGR